MDTGENTNKYIHSCQIHTLFRKLLTDCFTK